MSTTATRFHNYIGGQWSSNGQTFENRNPATGEVLGVYPASTPADVERAAQTAAEAYKTWRKVPAPRRGEILFRAAEIMVRRKEELARTMTREMGKVLNETRGDVQEGIDMTYYMAAEGRRQFGQVTPAELANKFAMAMRVPIGVVGALTPWNFPFAIPTWKITPALVTGNTMVWKPSPWTPETAYNLVKILEEAGLPPGVLNLVYGDASETVGKAVVDHPLINLVSFTGSTQVGTQVGTRCAELGKRVSLEMGGKNAIIVLDDADLDLAIEGILWSAFGTSGQRCTAASRVIVQRGIVDALTERLVARTAALKLGDGLDPATDVGPVVNQNQLKKIAGYMDVGRQEGAQILVGGEIAREAPLDHGYFFRPTVFANVRPNMRIAQEEIFGPVTALIPVDSLDEAIAVNNGVQYGLSSAIYTRDVNKAFRAIEDLSTGILYVNAGTIGAEVHLPFGGMRATGNGHREGGQAALDVFTEWKAVYVDYSGRLQKAQIDV